MKRNYGDGKLQVSGDGSAVYGEAKLLDKAQSTFEGLVKFGFLSHTDQNAFHAVSAKKTKAIRLSDDVYQAEYYDQQFNIFTKDLHFKLERVLVHHILSTVGKVNTVVARFAEGTLSARSAELSFDVLQLQILLEAREAKENAYTHCLEILSKEGQSIEDAVLDAYKEAKPIILKNARKMTDKDFENEDRTRTVPAVAFVNTIVNMARRTTNREITKRIVKAKEKYGKDFEFFIQSDHPDLPSIIEKANEQDKTLESGLGLLYLIRDAVTVSCRESFTEFSAKTLAQITGAALGIVKLDGKWKESIAQQILSTLDVKQLATNIVKNCRMKLDDIHQAYVEDHKQRIELPEARSGRNENDIRRLRTEFTPKIFLLLLRLYAMQCCFEKGEPERGEKLGEGRHSSLFACLSWNGVDTQNSLVLKVSNPLSQMAWERTAQLFYALR